MGQAQTSARAWAPSAGAARHGDAAEPQESTRTAEAEVVATIVPTALTAEMTGFDDLLRADFRTGLRVRTRFRRLVSAAALRYGGEVADRVGARVVCVFGRPQEAALAALEIRRALGVGSRKIAAHMVIHESGEGVARINAVARDLRERGDILALGPAARSLATRTDVPMRALGTFMLAGVPNPVGVAAVGESDEHGRAGDGP